MYLLSFALRIYFRKLLLLFLTLAAVVSCVERQSKIAETATHQTSNRHKEVTRRTKESAIPRKAYDVLRYIQKYHRAPKGHVGGKRFGNYERLLPQTTAGGEKINYQEWDVNPKRRGGASRGAERIVTSNDGRAWYTPDHYQSFIEMR